MASQGPRFPGTTATLANAGTSENAEAWVNPGNIVSDNATEAAITAATYDSPDISQLLVASNFTFTIPAGATIDGVTVEVDRRSIIASSGKDFRVQLATGTTFASLVGTNKAVPATIWPTTSAIATYGGAADTWAAGLTEAQVNAAGFAVFLSCQANIANADVGVDFIRVTITYTEAPLVVTPTTASLSTSAFAPTVTASDHKTVTPGVVSLALTTFAPSVTVGLSLVPLTASLSLAAFAPTVTATDNQTATPDVAGLSLTAFDPTVTASDHKLVTPGVTSLALASFAPVVTASDHQFVMPNAAALGLATFAPTVTGGLTVVPSTAVLTMTAFAPDVVLTDHKLVVSGAAGLALTAFAPAVTASVHQRVVPGLLGLTLTTFAPTVTGSQPAVFGGEPPVITAAQSRPDRIVFVRGAPRITGSH